MQLIKVKEKKEKKGVQEEMDLRMGSRTQRQMKGGEETLQEINPVHGVNYFFSLSLSH